jgi:SAM-dependent methyltransferase
MEAKAWNERYAAAERVWSVEPNVWVVEVVDGLEAAPTGAAGARAARCGAPRAGSMSPGRALDLACGEGRNAVWLAERGWRVTAVDFSAVALNRGRAASSAVKWIEADVVTWTPRDQAAFDLVALVYLHLPPAERRTVLGTATASLAPGGTLAVIGHDRRNLAEGVGGPQVPEILLDPGEVADELAALDIVRAETVPRPTPDGVALDTLVVARRPAPEPVDLR